MRRLYQVKFHHSLSCFFELAIGMIALICSITSCKSNSDKLPNIREMNMMQDDHANNVRFIFSKNGHTQATLSSDTFSQNNNAKPPYVDLKKNLKLISYDTLLHIESTVTADFARYFPQTGNIIAKGRVVVINKKGEKLETEELIWNQKLQKFYTDKFVRITMDGQITYGDGLEANQNFTWFKITHQKGVVPIDKSSLPLTS